MPSQLPKASNTANQNDQKGGTEQHHATSPLQQTQAPPKGPKDKVFNTFTPDCCMAQKLASQLPTNQPQPQWHLTLAHTASSTQAHLEELSQALSGGAVLVAKSCSPVFDH